MEMKLAIFAIVAISALSLAEGRATTEKNNSLRKGKAGSCNTNTGNLSTEDKALIVDTINNYRNQVALKQSSYDYLPFAKNMIQIFWDEALASKAQDFANTCKIGHSSNESVRKGAEYQIGENIYSKMWQNGTPKADWKGAIDEWWKQGYGFKNKPIDSFMLGGADTGDFTQLIWANSFLVGCGYSVFQGEYPGTITNLYVCQFGPTGNVVGKAIFKVAEKKGCECLDGLTCGNKDYPGLCCPTGQCTKDSVTYTGKTIAGTIS
jgi:hypothetical protein